LFGVKTYELSGYIMKKELLSILFLSFTVICNSQEGKFSIKSGAGYYTDVFTYDKGPILWLEGGYRFQTGISINMRLSFATMEWRIQEGLFEDYKTIEVRQMADLIFSRKVKIKGGNFIESGLGFKLKRDLIFNPGISEIYNGGIYYQDVGYSTIFYEIGFTFCLDYYYQFESNFYLGLRADSNVIWALGFEGLSVTPLFGFRF